MVKQSPQPRESGTADFTGSRQAAGRGQSTKSVGPIFRGPGVIEAHAACTHDVGDRGFREKSRLTTPVHEDATSGVCVVKTHRTSPLTSQMIASFEGEMSQVHAVIFDIDGTLLLSNEAHARAYLEAAAALGIKADFT